MDEPLKVAIRINPEDKSEVVFVEESEFIGTWTIAILRQIASFYLFHDWYLVHLLLSMIASSFIIGGLSIAIEQKDLIGLITNIVLLIIETFISLAFSTPLIGMIRNLEINKIILMSMKSIYIKYIGIIFVKTLSLSGLFVAFYLRLSYKPNFLPEIISLSYSFKGDNRVFTENTTRGDFMREWKVDIFTQTMMISTCLVYVINIWALVMTWSFYNRVRLAYEPETEMETDSS